jgi:hypothetical protein
MHLIQVALVMQVVPLVQLILTKMASVTMSTLVLSTRITYKTSAALAMVRGFRRDSVTARAKPKSIPLVSVVEIAPLTLITIKFVMMLTTASGSEMIAGSAMGHRIT